MKRPHGNRGTMKATIAADPLLQRKVANATRMIQNPWMWTTTDLKRCQNILRAAGLHNLANSVQPFIDQPALPLGMRRHTRQ